ncbi:MAG: DUF359 domain-containing protein, partial [Candidatus Micrarchaeota archaeon]|nr:DUF359 domain-containing protein [Candidatus Micrarchaeota archaeon]
RGDFPFIRKAYRRPVKVVNNRSELSLSLWKAVKRLSRAKDGAAIRVYGEEDLASLACIHFAKSGDIVIYGMRGRGMALIKVNKSIKRYVARVLKRMKSVEKH